MNYNDDDDDGFGTEQLLLKCRTKQKKPQKANTKLETSFFLPLIWILVHTYLFILFFLTWQNFLIFFA